MRIWKIGAVVAIAAMLAGSQKRLKQRRSGGSRPQDEWTPVDEAIRESFPASDPPSWTLGADRDGGA